jgi:hypothetical protein
LKADRPRCGPWLKSAFFTHMTKPDISGIAPFFIVKNVPAALSYYRDRLGFDVTFQGPEPDDIFFGIVLAIKTLLRP